MNQSDDLSKLFNRFGGNADTYREIVREDAATEAQGRWPLLSAVRVDRHGDVPAVQPATLSDTGTIARAPAFGLEPDVETPPASAASEGAFPLAATSTRYVAPPVKVTSPAFAAITPNLPSAHSPFGPPAGQTAQPSAAHQPARHVEPHLAPMSAQAGAAPAAAVAPVATAAVWSAAPAVSSAPEARAVAATPIWKPASGAAQPQGVASGAPIANAAGSSLARVFARLEGRVEPPATAERAPARRSFLDRLKRS